MDNLDESDDVVVVFLTIVVPESLLSLAPFVRPHSLNPKSWASLSTIRA